MYLRLTTSKLDQDLFTQYNSSKNQEKLRNEVLNGAYVFNSNITANDNPKVNIFSLGAVFHESIKAQQELYDEGISSNLVNITGPGPLYRDYQNNPTDFHLKRILNEHTTLPSLCIIDGHPHSLNWIGSALGTKSNTIGISEFGQSGDQIDLYEYYGFDKNSIQDKIYELLGI
tara:strand:+ start:43 stop:561 length:519 start_codon:yes stop_codon:yes gene_type:complete